MNRVELTGRLTRDPVITVTGTGTTIARFTLAVNRWKKDEADFISCTAFNKTADTIEKHVKKGSLIGVCGRIQTGSYTNRDGQKVYTTDVIVDEMDFLEKKDAQPQEQPHDGEWLNVPEDAVDDEGLPF